jgi:hypothetical protein
MTTETKDHREPVQLGFLPGIAGGEWSSWCDLSRDGGSVPPALTDRIVLGRAAQLRDFSAAPCCCCTHTWVSTPADPCLLSAYDTSYDMVGTVHGYTTEQTKG